MYQISYKDVLYNPGDITNFYNYKWSINLKSCTSLNSSYIYICIYIHICINYTSIKKQIWWSYECVCTIITVSDVVMHKIPVTYRTSWPLNVISCSVVRVEMVLGYELVNEVFVFHLPLNSHLLFYLKSPFLAVCTSFHHVWQWQNKERNRSPCTWRGLRGGGSQVFSRLDPLIFWDCLSLVPEQVSPW